MNRTAHIMHMIIHIATLEAKVALVASGVDDRGRLTHPGRFLNRPHGDVGRCCDAGRRSLLGGVDTARDEPQR